MQEQLIKANDGRELGKKLNGDEAQTLGASYQAAVNSKAFRVAKFIVKDAHLFPVQVRFEREVEGDDGEVTVKNVTRTIFHRHNELPQKKVLSFNKASGDFSFDVFFGELDFLSEEMLSMFGSRNISSVTVSGVQEKLEAHAEDKFQKVLTPACLATLTGCFRSRLTLSSTTAASSVLHVQRLCLKERLSPNQRKKNLLYPSLAT